MATRRDARFKLCRRFGVNVFGHAKALNRVKKDQRPKKMSEYGTQLLEKQKVKAYYNVLERQFVRYYDKAKKMQGVTGENMLFLLEGRLDNMVYRIGFGNSIRQARQMVNHGHIQVTLLNFVKLPATTKCSKLTSKNSNLSIFHTSKKTWKTSKAPMFVHHNVTNFLSK